jgi:HD-GYP domain-containing protein (c-di-GMP phosphodiesterase class II)/transcriptional regulator with GAF, ATPase, and Fis domain
MKSGMSTSGGPPTTSKTDLLALVREVTAALASAQDLDETLRLIARLTARSLGAWECDLYEYIPETRSLVATATWAIEPTPDDDEWLGDTIDVDELHDFRDALEKDTPVELHIDDPALDPRIAAIMERWGEKSWLLVPLVFGGKPIGVAEVVEEREVHRFSDAEKEIATTLAAPAAIAIHNARLRRRMAEQNRYLASLIASSRTINSTVDLDEVLRRVTREACEALDASRAAIYTYDAGRDAIVYQALHERGALPGGTDDALGVAYPLDEFPGDRAILHSPAIVLEHADDPDLPPDRRESMAAWGEATVLSVPLRYQEEPLGILRLYESSSRRAFAELELQFAAGLGELAGAAIHNAAAYRRQEARNRELSALLEASKAMASSVVLEDVLAQLAERAAVALGSPQCLIYEYDADRESLISRSLYCSPDSPAESYEDTLGTAYPLSDYPSDRGILKAGEIVVEHAGDPMLGDDVLDSMDAWGEKTCLTVPLVFRGAALGLMELIETQRERRFTPDELELARGLAEQAAVAMHNAALFRQRKEHEQRLVAILQISQGIAASLDAAAVVELVSEGIIGLFPRARTSAEIMLAAGDERFCPAGLKLGGGEAAAAAARSADELVVRALDRLAPLQEPWDYGRRLVVPLILQHRAEGYLDVRCALSRRINDDEIQLVQILINQAAVALENAANFARLETTYLETVTALAAAMEAKDHYTADHAQMLARMAVSVGRRLGLGESELRDLQYASVLHDIGKIGIPGSILNKADKLTDEEFRVMTEHTVIGERIISRIEYLAPIARVIRAAHERFDGSGYPDGLVGDEIPRLARIVFVCDAFHAMTSDRPYRKAMPEQWALKELRRNAGGQFDPGVVTAFCEAWPDFEDAAVEPRSAPVRA